MSTEWPRRSIAELADVIGGGTPSTKDPANFGGDIPWITPKDLSGYRRRQVARGERMITKRGLESSSARLLPRGSVLVSSRAPIGLTAIAEVPVTTNQGFRSLVPKDGVDGRFLYYLLTANRDELERHANGTTFQELSGSALKRIEFPVPDKDTQREIADVLSAFDAKIEANLHAVADARAFAHAAIADDIGGATTALGNLAKATRDTIDPAALGGTLVAHYSIPALDATGQPELVRASAIASVKFSLPTECVVVSRINPRIPRAWYVRHAPERQALGSTEFAVLTGISVPTPLVYVACTDPGFRTALALFVSGTSSSHQRVALGDLMTIEVPDCSRVSSPVGEAASAAIVLAEELEAEAVDLEQARDRLMGPIVNGAIPVSGNDHGQ